MFTGVKTAQQPTPMVAPAYRSFRPLGVVHRFRNDPLQMFEDLRSMGPVVRFRIANRTAFCLNEPELVKHVLIDNNRNYGKQAAAYHELRKIIGNGLVTSEGDFWRRQRRIAQPAFHRKRLAGFADTMTRMTRDMCERWRELEPDHELDIHEEMMALTLRIAATTLLSADIDDRDHALGEAVSTAIEYANDGITRVLHIHDWLPTPKGRKVRAAMKLIDDTLGRTIRERRESGEDREDLLGMFMAVVDEETGERMNDRQLRDEVVTMFMAGHETTANALAWGLYLLAREPQVVARAREEIAEVVGDREPSFSDFRGLEYLQRVFAEIIRLYPSAWGVSRTAIEDDVIGGYRIPKDSVVFLIQWLFHRDPRFWDDPTRFDPDRFLPERAESRPRFAYFPFAAGPRQCIGDNFAKLEGVLALAVMLRDFDFELLDPARVLPEASITLRPRNGIPMRVRPCAARP